MVTTEFTTAAVKTQLVSLRPPLVNGSTIQTVHTNQNSGVMHDTFLSITLHTKPRLFTSCTAVPRLLSPWVKATNRLKQMHNKSPFIVYSAPSNFPHPAITVVHAKWKYNVPPAKTEPRNQVMRNDAKSDLCKFYINVFLGSIITSIQSK